MGKPYDNPFEQIHGEPETMPLRESIKLDLQRFHGKQITLSPPEHPEIEINILIMQGYIYVERYVGGTAVEHSFFSLHSSERLMMPAEIMTGLKVDVILHPSAKLELMPFVDEGDENPQPVNVTIQMATTISSRNMATVALWKLQFVEHEVPRLEREIAKLKAVIFGLVALWGKTPKN